MTARPGGKFSFDKTTKVRTRTKTREHKPGLSEINSHESRRIRLEVSQLCPLVNMAREQQDKSNGVIILERSPTSNEGCKLQSEPVIAQKVPSSSVVRKIHLNSEMLNSPTEELGEMETLDLQIVENQEEISAEKGKMNCNNNMPKKRRKELKLAEKIDVLKYAETFSERETAEAFGISKTAVHSIKKNKLELKAMYSASNKAANRCRRVRNTKNVEINKKTYRWFWRKVKNNEHVTNKNLQGRALLYAQAAGVTNFCASKGWLESFKKRFGITLARSVAHVSDANIEIASSKARNSKKMHQELFEEDEAEECFKFRVLKKVPILSAPKMRNSAIEDLTF